MNKRTLVSIVPALALSSAAFAEAAPAEAPNGFFASLSENPIVKKLFEVQWYTWAVLVALIVLAVFLMKSGKKGRFNTRMIAYAAMCIAISFVLSSIRLFKMPQGGSITPFSKLPLIMYAVSFGPVPGALVGCAYGLLDLLNDPFVIHPLQLLVDYPLAFGFMALGGFAAKMPLPKRYVLPIAVVLGYIGRYAMAVLSGTVFFAEYAPAGQAALAYSLVYNISYLGPDALLCLLVAFVPGLSRLTEAMKSKIA